MAIRAISARLDESVDCGQSGRKLSRTAEISRLRQEPFGCQPDHNGLMAVACQSDDLWESVVFSSILTSSSNTTVPSWEGNRRSRKARGESPLGLPPSALYPWGFLGLPADNCGLRRADGIFLFGIGLGLRRSVWWQQVRLEDLHIVVELRSSSVAFLPKFSHRLGPFCRHFFFATYSRPSGHPTLPPESDKNLPIRSFRRWRSSRWDKVAKATRPRRISLQHQSRHGQTDPSRLPPICPPRPTVLPLSSGWGWQ